MNEHVIRRYTVGEEIFNSVSHGIGAVLAVCGTVVLVVLNALYGNGASLLIGLIYGLSLVVLYTMSTVYHAVPAPRAKEVLRIFDHASIFLLIAGSYTPFCLIVLAGNPKGAAVAAAVWLCALAGIVLNAVSLKKTEKLSMVLYVVMGWSVLAVLRPVVQGLPTTGFWLLLLGGLSYTGGIVFYAIKKPYMHSIWHLFVLAGSILHFLCVAGYVMPMVWH